MPKQTKYASYDEVPVFRKQWFFWLTFLFITPVAIVISLSGDIYYVKKDEVKSFGIQHRIVVGIIAFFYIMKVIAFFKAG